MILKKYNMTKACSYKIDAKTKEAAGFGLASQLSSVQKNNTISL